MHDRLRDPDILIKIGEWKSAGLTYRQIADKLEKEENIKSGELSIRRVWLRYLSKSKELMKGDKQFGAKLKKQWIDSLSQLKEINSRIVDKFRDATKTADIVLLAREIRADIYLQEKVLKELNKVTEHVEMSALQITDKLGEILKELDKTGYITIHHLPELYQKKTIKITKKKLKEKNEENKS